MEEPFFSLKTQKIGLLKYILLASLPALLFLFFGNVEGAAAVFFFLSFMILLGKNHTIIVFHNEMVEKDYRGRFVRKVLVSQINYYRRSFPSEIHLIDHDEKILLCIESNMTNRDRFVQWLEEHYIESK